MTRTLRSLAALAILGLALPLGGCNLDVLVVQIPDFDSKQVMGLTLWRTNARGGVTGRALDVQLLEPRFDEQGVELVGYSYVENGETVEVWNQLHRDPANPDQVLLGFVALPVPEGVSYRISTFNAKGQSAPSAQSFVL
jgi:hypothetical protein